MYKAIFLPLALVAASIAWAVPVEYVEETHIVQIDKRQADVAQLLGLASLAGITALPTDPAVLLQLGPLANSLASALPTPSVLSVLVTAAPSGFVSSIVNDQSYAASFESAFSAGSSPSWFNGLPTGVKSYLHTYSGFGGLATAAGAIKDATSSEGSALGGSATRTTGSAASQALMTAGSSSASGASMTSGASDASALSSSASAAASTAQSSVTSGISSERSTSSSSAPAAAETSASAQSGAAPRALVMTSGVAGLFGLLGMAIAW